MLKRRIILLFIILLCILSSCKTEPEPIDTEEPKPHDFMVADWGMSKAKVQKAQLPETELYAEDNIMFYEIEKDYDTIEVYYHFLDDSFVKGECMIEMGTEVWSKRVPDMINSYEKFREEIILTFGEPLSKDYRVWLDKDPEYENDDDMHNLYYQRLEYLTEWETENSLMTLKLYYKNRDFKFEYEAIMKDK